VQAGAPSFASSAFAHYLELTLRFAVGGAFLLRAPRMLFADAFALFGWLLVMTTAVLCAVPWRWHQRFAQRAVTAVAGHLKLVAAASLALGALVLASVIWGAAAQG
jgi:hypothetical protein